MPKEICLTINEDGSMSISQEDTEEPKEGTPVKSIDEALQVIREMAKASALPEDEMMEQDAMMEGFNGGMKGMM